MTFHVHYLRLETTGWKSLNNTILFYYAAQLKNNPSHDLITLELIYDLIINICDELIRLSSTPLHQVIFFFNFHLQIPFFLECNDN